MTDEMIAVIAFAVGCVVAVLTYRSVRWKKSRKRKFIENAQRNGCCVRGEYESSKVYLSRRLFPIFAV